MKVLNVELLESKRMGMRVIPGGVHIHFESAENVKKDDYFKINLDGKLYYFKAVEIKVEGKNLKITAQEVGYYAYKLDFKGIDLRSVIGLEVLPVNDLLKIKEIEEQSCWL